MASSRQVNANRVAVIGALLLTVSAGCAGQSGPMSTPTPRASSPDTYQPVTAAGIDSCEGLPLGTAGAGAPNRLPDLELPCLVPAPAVNLADLGGTPVLVNLWATWCGPCREEMPILQDAQTRHGDKIAFLGVDTKDNPEQAASFLQEMGVTYPQVVDLDGRLLAEHLRLPGLPVTLVVDAEGEIIEKHIGPLTAETLDALIDQVTGG